MNTLIQTKPKVKVDHAIKALTQTEHERCTIVHCKLAAAGDELMVIRIWKSVCLVEDTGRSCKLVKPFNITVAPEWTDPKVENNLIRFTLVFEGLSKKCDSFTLIEAIPEPGGFYSDKVERNSSDVYEIEVF